MEFETDRLAVRELAEDDLEAFLPVYLGNADYLSLTSGFGGEPGRYDLESLQRDFAVARITPGRHVAGMYTKAAGEPVGVLDWLEENRNQAGVAFAARLGFVPVSTASRRLNADEEVVVYKRPSAVAAK